MMKLGEAMCRKPACLPVWLPRESTVCRPRCGLCTEAAIQIPRHIGPLFLGWKRRKHPRVHKLRCTLQDVHHHFVN